MEHRNLSYCCTGEIFGKMGETYAAQGGAGTPDLEVLKEEIRQLRRDKRNAGYAFIMCTVNDQQPQAIAMLEELHFQSTPWMGKTYHAETKVKIYWYPLENLKPAKEDTPWPYATSAHPPP